MSPLDRAAQAIIAELHRQADTTGCTTEDHGDIVEVDGHFKARPLVRAVLQAIREPSEAMVKAGEAVENPNRWADEVWQAMVGAALEEG